MTDPRVTIIVIAFKTSHDLLSASLASARQLDGTELIVIDNSPTDALRDVFGTMADEWISGHGNIGFARAANLGVRAARGSHVLLLNPDASLSSGALDALIRAAGAAPGSLFCGWLEQQGVPQVDAYLHWWSSTGRLLRRRAYRTYLESTTAAAPPIPVQKVCGGGLFAATRLLEDLGPFDERFFLYGEDADLSVRARKQEIGLYAVPGARIEHRAASSQVAHSVLVEQARADAAVRITRYNLPRVLSLLAQLDLLVVTALGLVGSRASSSASARGRRSRFAVILGWGLRRDRAPFAPAADDAAGGS